MFSKIGQWLNRNKSIFFLTFAGLLLLLAQSAFWINQTLFDKQTFTSTANSVIQTEESREAIASTVVDKALVNRPILQRTISAKATQLITGLLGTDLAGQTFSGVLDKTYTYITSKDPEPISIDLIAIKTPVAGLISFAEQQGREVTFDPDAIPDSIELFNPESLPDIYRYSMITLLLGPICWITVGVIFAAYLYRGRRAYAKRVYIVGIVIILSSLLGLLIGPLLPPPVVAQVPLTGLRSVVDDLIRAFLAPFMRQMIVTISITLIVLLIFNQRFVLLGLLQKFSPKKTEPVTTEAKMPTTAKRASKRPKKA